jgi:hypothetical protein
MRVRAELVAQRRARLFALMRGLWAQLRVVSSLAPERPDRAAEFERLFGLREEIETELSTT